MKSLALLLIGAWLAGTAAMAFVATQNFRTVDRILTSPTPQAVPSLSMVPRDSLRPMLRYLSSELNRLYFWSWGITEVALGIVVMTLLLMLGLRTESMIAAAMLAIATIQLVLMTPRITTIGRALDFVPRNPVPPDSAAVLAEFWRLHAAFTSTDLLLLVLGLVLSWKLGSSGQSPSARLS